MKQTGGGKSPETIEIGSTRTVKKIHETRSFFFEKINNTDKPLKRLTGKKERGYEFPLSGMKWGCYYRSFSRQNGNKKVTRASLHT